MCIYKNGKYSFKTSGRTMGRIDIENLSQDEMNELYETKANAMELLYIKRNIYDLRSDIQNISDTITIALDEMKKHTDECPINKPKIYSIIDVKIDEYNGSVKMAEGVRKVINTSIISTGRLATAIIAIMAFLTGFGVIIFVAAKGMKW